MLCQLPQEILDMIIGFIPSKEDRRSINLVSKDIHYATTHHLYHTLTFSARDEMLLNVLDTKRFVKVRTDLDHLKHVRSLAFTAPFRIARSHRCSYRTVYLYESHLRGSQENDPRMFHGDFLCDMLSQIRIIFDQLEIGSLRSFQWHMGTCLPAHILDEDGYLTICQQNIQLLSLRVDASCPHAGLRLGGLVAMSNLRSFTLESISTFEELSLVRKCIERNAGNLRVLDLVFTPRFTLVGSTRHLMSALGTLSRLHTLSLTRFPFEKNAENHLCLFLVQLHSLTLRDCPRQMEMLEELSRFRISTQLRYFEISLDELWDSALAHTLDTFLESFNTLEHLHILASNSLTPENHLNPIQHHPLLSCFVYHTRRLFSFQRSPTEETQDFPVSLFHTLRTTLCKSSIQNLGLCVSPLAARCILDPIVSHLQIEVLHLRLSGYDHPLCDFEQRVSSRIISKAGTHDMDDWILSDSEHSEGDWSPNLHNEVSPAYHHHCSATDLVTFADWAFGPYGIKTLKVLAYGDFTCGDRCSQQQVLLVQDSYSQFATTPYRISSIRDDEVPDSVLKTIAACPLEDLMDADNEFWHL
ncbi:hypothetical protein BGW36DRAFT_431081 [Talaromyces proteolyticus]|uniref:F-box domain-containing protein n=1 Tax=Talaromyces proteolyticus TaxID=1131652 RepID=A0AAD4KGS3_9EURO|nr:uncharacterized protein BGW36DRAFT_431081 [Talaromyces proteolyticus]KAH8691834.1 hypothetical protein BGW36DRAFT_431081 [Talaromyces proteolyticus]